MLDTKSSVEFWSNLAQKIYWDFRDASRRKSYFFSCKYYNFLQPEAEIAITSKQLKLQTWNLEIH